MTSGGDRARPCHILRVFTRGAEGGNRLGVVMDVTSLTTNDMAGIAADLGFSETVFVDQASEVPHCRIFTPTNEMPFAGHPLVGTAWVLKTQGLGGRDPEGLDKVTCGIGDVGISFDGERAWIEAPLDQDVRPLDLDGNALGLPTVVSAYQVLMPLRYTVVELGSAQAVGDYEPIEEVLAASRDGEHMMVYARSDAVRARFFAPASGVFEDPATGSAAVALAATLAYRGESTGEITISQGEEVGYPSTIELNWNADRARVGGTVVLDEIRLLEGAPMTRAAPH